MVGLLGRDACSTESARSNCPPHMASSSTRPPGVASLQTSCTRRGLSLLSADSTRSHTSSGSFALKFCRCFGVTLIVGVNGTRCARLTRHLPRAQRPVLKQQLQSLTCSNRAMLLGPKMRQHFLKHARCSGDVVVCSNGESLTRPFCRAAGCHETVLFIWPPPGKGAAELPKH